MPLSDEEFNEMLQRRLAADDDARDDEDASGLGFEDCNNEDLCDEDAADLAIMREALGNYKAETLAWAEQRSATMPAPRSGAVATLWHRTPRWALVGAAAAACAVAVVGVTHVPSAARGRDTAATAPTAQVLAADNQLLSSVDKALAGNSTPSEQELGLSSTDLSTHAQDTHERGRTQNAIN